MQKTKCFCSASPKLFLLTKLLSAFFFFFLVAKVRIMNNLKKFDTPKPPLPLQTMKAPVPVISSASLVSQKDAIQLMRADLNILQQHAR